MTYSKDALQAELIRDEGLELRAYKDTAKPPRWTIGIGRNLTDVGISAGERQTMGLTVQSCIAYGITRPEALALYANDVAGVEAGLDARIPWWRMLSDVRQRVLLNMGFQLGVPGLMAFKDTLAAIQHGAWATAATCMRNSLWHTQVTARADRLIHMIETGETA